MSRIKYVKIKVLRIPPIEVATNIISDANRLDMQTTVVQQRDIFRRFRIINNSIKSN